VFEKAKEHGLDVMTHRPINAIPPPDFHIGDWARRESFIKLRDLRPQPPALALIVSVCRDVLVNHGLPAFYKGGLTDIALHTALSAPVSVALSGARDEQYVDNMLDILSKGPLPEKITAEIFLKVQALMTKSDEF